MQIPTGRTASFFLWTMAVCIVVVKVLIFQKFNLGWIDSDQPFMWMGAHDYAGGVFSEPRYYGQDYNTFMEALVAVPLLWCGMPVYYAVPIATHLIFLFPFFFIAIYLVHNQRPAHALVVLAWLCCMTVEGELLASLPRGFVTGMFFNFYLVASMLAPTDMRKARINTMLSVIGYSVNPNSLLVSGPVLFYLFAVNYRDRRFYWTFLWAGITYGIMFCLLDLFYKLHPEALSHGLVVKMSFEYFKSNLTFLRDLMVHLTPLDASWWWLWPAMLVIVTVFLYRSDRASTLAIPVLLLLITVALFSPKSTDGTDWVFFSISRFYMAVPLLFILLLTRLPLKLNATLFCVMPLAAIGLFLKFQRMNSTIERQCEAGKMPWVGVHLLRLDGALEAINFYGQKCKENNVTEFIISNLNWLNTIVGYGGPSTDPSYPHTMETRYEKRLYALKHAEETHAERLVYLAERSEVDSLLKGQPFKLTRLDYYGLFLVTENRLSNKEFARVTLEAEIKLRGSEY